MPTLTTVASVAVGSARMTANLATIPVRLTNAVLDSPRVARRDPASRRLSELRRSGWRPTEVRLAARSTEVELERGDERQTVGGATLAFAAYATRAGVADGASVVRSP